MEDKKKKEEIIEKKVTDLVTNEVFKLFSKQQFEEARVLLHTLYLENYATLKDLRAKRLLLHNLVWAEKKLGEFKSAEVHIKIIKAELESDVDFIQNNMEDYCLVLNMYAELYKDIISIEEYKEVNIFIANYHHEKNNIGREAIALSNVYIADKRWSDIVLLIKSLLESNERNYYIVELLSELEKYDTPAYNEAKILLNGRDLTEI